MGKASGPAVSGPAASGPGSSYPPPPSATDRAGRLRFGSDWRRLVILAAVAAVIAGAVYLVVGSLSGGSTILGVLRVMGVTAGITLVIGAVMTAIGARMRRRRGGD